MPERIQMKRTKGWRMPPNTVYVGRPSMWGNPYRVVNEEGWPMIEGPGTYVEQVNGADWDGAQRRVVELFREWMATYMKPDFLRGKNLACWCKPGEPCHADVLLELANKPR